jgi:hypothetical protein
MPFYVRAVLDILSFINRFLSFLLNDDICTPDCVLSNCRMVREWWNGKDVRGRCSGLIEALSGQLPVRTEKSTKGLRLGESVRHPSFERDTCQSTPKHYHLSELPRFHWLVLTFFTYCWLFLHDERIVREDIAHDTRNFSETNFSPLDR